MFVMKIGSMTFPLGPSSITKKESNKNETIMLINEGEINRRMPAGLRDYTIDFVIPGTKLPFAYYPKDKFVKPSKYIEYLRKLKKEKRVVKVIITRRVGEKKFGSSKFSGKNLNSPFVTTSTIEDFTETESAANGLDREVSLNLKMWRHYGTKKVVIKKKSNGKTMKGVVVKRMPSTKTTTTKTYMVKKGDTLSGIAKRKLGSYSRWKEIYKLNKTVIEKAAKKHGRKSSSNGHWIYPGTKLKLPKK